MGLKSGWSGSIPKPACSKPRAPEDAIGRTFSMGNSASPRFCRIRLTARPRSAAVSASVPSKSNNTARVPPGTALARILGTAERVVDGAVLAQPVFAAERVVRHALQFDRFQAGFAAPARKLRRPDEARVIVRAFRQHLEHVLRAKHGNQVGLGIAVDGGEEDA